MVILATHQKKSWNIFRVFGRVQWQCLHWQFNSSRGRGHDNVYDDMNWIVKPAACSH